MSLNRKHVISLDYAKGLLRLFCNVRRNFAELEYEKKLSSSFPVENNIKEFLIFFRFMLKPPSEKITRLKRVHQQTTTKQQNAQSKMAPDPHCGW